MIKDTKTSVLLIGVAVVALIAGGAVYAGGGHGESACRGHKNMSLLKDANSEVTKTSEGLIVTVTSDKPQVVKAIQARLANFGKGCKDAKAEVTNTSKGLIITVTSDEPQILKAIQARFANFGKGRGPCGHVEGSEACKKARESGKCEGKCGGKRGNGCSGACPGPCGGA